MKSADGTLRFSTSAFAASGAVVLEPSTIATPMLDAASEYRCLGLSVIPVGADKKPLVAWRQYQDALPHPDQVNEWWTRWPEANVGVVTGRVSGIVVLDADGPRGLKSLKSLGPAVGTWVSRTGRPDGGCHVFYRHPQNVRIGNRAGILPGLDVRGDGGYVVVPPSCHPSGRLYKWVRWLRDVDLAPLPPHLLDLLRDASVRTTVQPLARPLSPRMQKFLRDGEVVGHRSTLIQSLALAAYNAGWSEDEFFFALMDPKNHAGDKIRDRRDRREYVARCWDKARRKAERTPPIRNRDDARKRIQEMRAAASTHRWEGLAGMTDRAVLDAHQRLAHQLGSVTYRADVRTMAVEAEVSTATVSRSQNRLRDAGWLELVRRDVGAAALWTLLIPRRCTSCNSPISTSSQGDVLSETALPPLSGTCGDCCREYAPADVWRHEGLGKAKLRVWLHLDSVGIREAGAIATHLGVQRRVIQRHLAELKLHHLAVRDGGGWRRGDADLTEVAQALGVAGVGQLQRARHERERECYQDLLVRRDRAHRERGTPA